MIGTKLTASAGNLMEALADLNRFFQKIPQTGSEANDKTPAQQNA
jgi:hypothetical protein